MAFKDRATAIWKALGDLSTVIWLVGLFGGTTAASKAISMMPGNWHPPQYWALGGAWFFGTLLLIVGGTRLGAYVWKLANPPRLEFVPHGGAEVSLVICPSQSGDFYGTGWLLDADAKRKRPFALNWAGGYVGQYRPVRNGDKTALRIAAITGNPSDPDTLMLVVYGDAGIVREWGFMQDIEVLGALPWPWKRFRVEVRAKQFPNIWAGEFRFRLNKRLELEVERLG